MGSNRREPEILVGDDIFAGIDDLPKAEGHVVEHPPYVCDVCGAPEGKCIHFGGTNYKVIPIGEVDTVEPVKFKKPEEVSTGPERKPCPECGKEVTWTKAGKPRSHKCEPKNTLGSGNAMVCSQCGSADYGTCDHAGCAVITKAAFDNAQRKEETTEAPKPTGITVDMVVAKFIETRDLIAEKQKALKTELAELNEVQKKRLAWLQGQLDKMGVESFKTKAGTAFIDWKDSATVAERGAFFDWVHEDWEKRECFLENRVSKTAVKQRLEDGEVTPPGVNYSKFKDVKIRRA